MDLAQLDPADLHRSSRLKIRRAPSCRISATSASSSCCLSHGSCSRLKAAASFKTSVHGPLIIHTVDPEIMNVEPAEFMQVVQLLTGSPGTRRFVRTCMRRSKEVQKQAQSSEIPEVRLLQEGTDSLQDSDYDELQQMGTTFLGVGADQFPSPSFRNPALINMISDNSTHLVQGVVSPLSTACNDASNSTTSYSLGSPLSSAGTNQQVNHPVLSSSSDSAMRPLNYRGLNTCSPSSSLSTTSSSEALNSVSTEIEEAYWGALFPEQDGTASWDGGIDFFDFSLDSYYANFDAMDCLTT